MTLIELLVAISVGSVLLAGVAAVFVSTLQGVSTTNAKSSNGSDARIAIEAMTRTLKVATIPKGYTAAFGGASTIRMQFFALLNRSGAVVGGDVVPTLVSYSWDSDPTSATKYCVRETLIQGVASTDPNDPTPSFPSSAAVTRCLLRTTVAPNFAYYTSGLLSAVPIPADTAISSLTVLGTIRSVRLRITATDPTYPNVPGSLLENRVTCENLLTSGS